jgi:hypothetical protein
MDPIADKADGKDPSDDGEPGKDIPCRWGDVGGEGRDGAECGDDGIDDGIDRTPYTEPEMLSNAELIVINTGACEGWSWIDTPHSVIT